MIATNWVYTSLVTPTIVILTFRNICREDKLFWELTIPNFFWEKRNYDNWKTIIILGKSICGAISQNTCNHMHLPKCSVWFLEYTWQEPVLEIYLKIQKLLPISLHKKWSFALNISSVNDAKSAGKCGFGHIYWRNPLWKTSFFCVVFVNQQFICSTISANNYLIFVSRLTRLRQTLPSEKMGVYPLPLNYMTLQNLLQNKIYPQKRSNIELLRCLVNYHNLSNDHIKKLKNQNLNHVYKISI